MELFFSDAGVDGPMASIEDYPDENFDRVMEVNVRGFFLGLKRVLPFMSSGGSIVSTASTAGVVGAESVVAYVASKHAVIGITRTACSGVRLPRDSRERRVPRPGRRAHDGVP